MSVYVSDAHRQNLHFSTDSPRVQAISGRIRWKCLSTVSTDTTSSHSLAREDDALAARLGLLFARAVSHAHQALQRKRGARHVGNAAQPRLLHLTRRGSQFLMQAHPFEDGHRFARAV